MVSLIRNIKLILQQNGNVIWRQESARKGLNTTSGALFVAQRLVKPIIWFARAVVTWRSPTAAKSAYYIESATGLGLTTCSWVARDVTKNQTKKLSILLSFYFHEVLQYLNTFT